RDVERSVHSGPAEFDRCSGDEEVDRFDRNFLWKTHADPLRGRGYDLAQRTFHHHRIVQIDEVYSHRIFLSPGGDVENAGSCNRYNIFPIGRPPYRVPQQPAVIGTEHFPERAVDVPGEVDDAPGSDLAQENTGNV